MKVFYYRSPIPRAKGQETEKDRNAKGLRKREGESTSNPSSLEGADLGKRATRSTRNDERALTDVVELYERIAIGWSTKSMSVDRLTDRGIFYLRYTLRLHVRDIFT